MFVGSSGWHVRSKSFLLLIRLAFPNACTFLIGFLLSLLVIHYLFSLFFIFTFHNDWPIHPAILVTFGAVRCSRVYLFFIRSAWMFSVSNRCLLMVSVTLFMITVMEPIDCQLSAVGSSTGCIEVVLALSLDVTSRLLSTCPLFAVQKRKFTRVAKRLLLGVLCVLWLMLPLSTVFITSFSGYFTIPFICQPTLTIG